MDHDADFFQVRPYRPGDEAAAYDICLKTGADGQDATRLYGDDPDALGRIYVGPYLEFAPEFAWVLEDVRGVCGYALAALDSKAFYAFFLDRWLPELRRKFPAPTGDPKGWTPAERARHEYHFPSVHCPEPRDAYPSHLHIDLLSRAQGKGHGRKMMLGLMEALKAAGSPGVHLGMSPKNLRAEQFYRKLGFVELERGTDVLYLGRRLADPLGGEGQSEASPAIE